MKKVVVIALVFLSSNRVHTAASDCPDAWHQAAFLNDESDLERLFKENGNRVPLNFGLAFVPASCPEDPNEGLKSLIRLASRVVPPVVVPLLTEPRKITGDCKTCWSTPLSLYACKKQWETVADIIKNGVSPYGPVLTLDGYTYNLFEYVVLDAENNTDPLMPATKLLDLLEVLAKHGLSYCPKKIDVLGAVVSSNNPTMLELVLNKNVCVAKSRVNQPCTSCNDGLTPLMLAACLGSEECVQILLKHGADVNTPHEKTGGTALHYAAANKKDTTMCLLEQHGADKSIRLEDGSTAKMLRDSAETVDTLARMIQALNCQ